jgi:putative membrane protein
VAGPHDTAPQRTQLAWQRTALSLVVAALVLLRLTMDTLGPVALATCGIAVSTAVWAALESRQERRPQRSRPAALLTCSVVALAATELAALV